MTITVYNYTTNTTTNAATWTTGTITITTPFFSSPHHTCEICKNTIYRKYIYLEIREPKEIKITPTAGTLPFIYPKNVRTFYFHMKCFLENIKHLKKLVILEEILR
jgi:hypothetical protein